MSTDGLKKLQVSDWPLLREIRLKALKSDPGVFGSNYQKELQMTDDDWRGWLSNPDSAIFGIFADKKIIGMTGIAIDRNDSTKTRAILWGSWLEPEYRSKGLSRMMYEARLDWARNHPTCAKICVSHRGSNIISKHANQKFGFIHTHATSKEWPDGTWDDELHYELVIKKI